MQLYKIDDDADTVIEVEADEGRLWETDWSGQTVRNQTYFRTPEDAWASFFRRIDMMRGRHELGLRSARSEVERHKRSLDQITAAESQYKANHEAWLNSRKDSTDA